MAFLTAFGASGLITSAYGWYTLQSSLFALFPASRWASSPTASCRTLYGQEASSVLEVSSLVGRTGVIEVGVPQSGRGRVLMSTVGGPQQLYRPLRDGHPSPSGESVVVKSTLGTDLVVARTALVKE